MPTKPGPPQTRPPQTRRALYLLPDVESGTDSAAVPLPPAQVAGHADHDHPSDGEPDVVSMVSPLNVLIGTLFGLAVLLGVAAATYSQVAG